MNAKNKEEVLNSILYKLDKIATYSVFHQTAKQLLVVIV